jgi:hypothetical protein
VRKNLDDINGAVSVQTHQVDAAQTVAIEIHKSLANLKAEQRQNQDIIEKFDAQMDDLLCTAGIFEPDVEMSDTDLLWAEGVLLDVAEAAAAEDSVTAFQRLDIVEPTDNWAKYLGNVADYAEKHRLDLGSEPWRQLLPQPELIALEKSYNIKFGDIKWYKWDYAAVFLSAAMAVLVDYFIVGIPKDMVFLGKNYTGGPVTRFFKSNLSKIDNADPNATGVFSWLRSTQKMMETWAKVPFDYATNQKNVLGCDVPGLNPNHHRLQSFGHDPILGFIVGVLDIIRGQMTVVGRDGVIRVIDRSAKFKPQNPFSALAMLVVHLLSDIPTERGVPAPFLSCLQCINCKSPFVLRTSGETVSFNDISRFMYRHGYTIEHFATMGIVPVFIDIILNTYYRLSYFETLFTARESYSSKHDVKFKSMQCLAHSMASAGNIAKMWLYVWNPLAFNMAEFLRTVHSFYALYKAKQERNAYIDCELSKEWELIYNNTFI